MSYLFNNPKFSRILDIGLKNIEHEIQSIPASNPSNRLVDYMYLAEFKDILEHTKTIQQVMAVNPIPLMGFTKEKQVNLLKSLLAGADLQTSLDVACIKQKHYEYWVKLADRNIQPFQDFVEQCVLAQALSKLELIQMVKSMGPKGAIALLQLKHAEQVERNKVNAPQLLQQVNVNICDRKPEEKKELVDDFFANVDPRDIINYPIKDIE